MTWTPPDAVLEAERQHEHEMNQVVADMLDNFANNFEETKRLIDRIFDACEGEDGPVMTDVAIPACLYLFLQNLNVSVREANDREFRELACRLTSAFCGIYIRRGESGASS